MRDRTFVTTRGVRALLTSDAEIAELRRAVARHIEGDWGDVCAEDAAVNTAAMRSGGMMLGVYEVRGVTVWVITDPRVAGQPPTITALLPSEY
jgi:hypothetical protein